MTQTKRLLENGNVEVTTVNEIQRYEGRAFYDEALSDMVIDDFTSNCKIWAKDTREGFGRLNTRENWEPECESLEQDLESFQKYLDETYGKDKYEAYALGAYIHSSVSFAFNKGEDTRCRWDSGTVGFIGIPKEGNWEAHNLTEAWNNSIITYQVWDNLNDDEVDSTDDLDWDTCREWKDQTNKEYGIEWNEVDVKY